ncbi:MAG: nucleotidyltransferase domain-containing protein [Candidatus Acididesulfobacter diazotrophicus]|jgi:predicted nucleotidyltransferase|uniref:Nucleotidyltransferase domain-containing protein n=1 Tax=Candidatus Acididesulfobacter diazotrophicus TaxID=2597226 RepID=A0A519BP07_9DELT|nr:MAG: nucleotidyltransferase domain-containing protein [Candidatus Acididesulfobacter diazotrophicus]
MENKEYILNTAKQIITEEIEKAGYKVEAIYLFGSRARGDYKEYSDWDFFVVTNRDLIKNDLINVLRFIREKIVENIDISTDIIIKSKNLYEHQQIGTGFLSYYVNKEGVSL